MEYNVIGLVRKKSNINSSQLYSEVLIDDISGDISKINISKIDIIIHLAALTHSKVKNYQDYLNVNVKGTENIVNLGVKISTKLIIMLSSIKVNGEGFRKNNIKYSEKCNPEPNDFYGNQLIYPNEEVKIFKQYSPTLNEKNINQFKSKLPKIQKDDQVCLSKQTKRNRRRTIELRKIS